MSQLNIYGAPEWCSGAEFDEHRAHRYTLWRREHVQLPGYPSSLFRDGLLPSDPPFIEPVVCWVMLNPSTADEADLDPTLRRCRSFTKGWGFRGFFVVNLFAFRSTDPTLLYHAIDPVGMRNDEAILRAVSRASLVVAGWGTHGSLHGRGEAVRAMLAARGPVYCLGTNADGSPRHPLYLKATTRLELFAGQEDRPPDGQRAVDEYLGVTHDPDCDLGKDCTCRS